MSTTEVTSHTVYPTGYDDMVHSDKSTWAITVRRVSRDRDLWMVESGRSALNRKGERDYIPMNSSRTKRWEKSHWFPLADALALAERFVDTLRWNCHTAQEASDWVAARLAADAVRADS